MSKFVQVGAEVGLILPPEALDWLGAKLGDELAASITPTGLKLSMRNAAGGTKSILASPVRG
ncbi:hypothetical protein [Sphingomonas sp. CGMCC 1.13658]|nr:hypothetical protein [Sphingomonas sp. CGMCC 1.13658]MBA2919130.1 hypothetical protein [Sphingomonas sp. CGMCC 1.13658]